MVEAHPGVSDAILAKSVDVSDGYLIRAQGAQPTRRYTVLNFPLGTVYFHAETTQEKCANYSQPVTVAQKTNSYTTDHVYPPDDEPQTELCYSQLQHQQYHTFIQSLWSHVANECH
jgi:hypothetical protein